MLLSREKRAERKPYNYNMIENSLMGKRIYPSGVVPKTPILESASLPPFAHRASNPFDRLRTGHVSLKYTGLTGFFIMCTADHPTL